MLLGEARSGSPRLPLVLWGCRARGDLVPTAEGVSSRLAPAAVRGQRWPASRRWRCHAPLASTAPAACRPPDSQSCPVRAGPGVETALLLDGAVTGAAARPETQARQTQRCPKALWELTELAAPWQRNRNRSQREHSRLWGTQRVMPQGAGRFSHRPGSLQPRGSLGPGVREANGC